LRQCSHPTQAMPKLHGANRFVVSFLIVGLVWCGSAWAQALSCRPTALYEGETLTVDLPMPHHSAEFAIWDWDTDHQPLMISFAPRLKDTIPPVIAPEEFAKMKQVKLLTTKAKGSPGTWWSQAPDRPTALKPRQLVFTERITYGLMLGYHLGAEDSSEHILGRCGIDYFARPRPIPGARVRKEDVVLIQEPHRNPWARLRCPRRTLYRGQTFTIGLPKSHRDDQFAILNPNWDIMVLSFVPGPLDKVAPVIPARNFARLRRLTLSTGTARASIYGPPLPTGTRPQLIFTHTGWYLAMIAGDFTWNDNRPFGSCWFRYIDQPRNERLQRTEKGLGN
jgi:hypothetical protein